MTVRTRPILRAAGFGILLLLGACGSSAPPATNVLVVVVDSLRSDYVGAYQSGTSLTPNLDRLANRAVRFTHAYAESSWTKPSVATLFTSLYPEEHTVFTLAGSNSRLPELATTLAEVLHANGVATVGFTNNLLIQRESGYAQGFDVYHHEAEVDGKRLLELLLDALGAIPAAEPWFAYVHLMDTHIPYDFDRYGGYVGFWGKLLKMDRQALLQEGLIEEMEVAYRKKVAWTDELLGRFLEDVEDRYPGTWILLTADHGDEFGEHGDVSHGLTLHDEVVHIPLIVREPGSVRGSIDTRMCGLKDIAPTVLDIFEVPAPAPMRGASLLESAEERMAFFELETSEARIFAVRSREEKLIRRKPHDPDEQRVYIRQPRPAGSALAAHPPTTEGGTNTLARALDEHQRTTAEARLTPAPPDFGVLRDARKLRQLEALGYVTPQR